MSLQGGLRWERGLTVVTRKGVRSCDVSCKTAAPCETLPAQTTLGDFDQAHKVVGLVRVVLKLCVPVESEVAVFTLEEVGLPEMLVQGNPGVDSFSASVAVEWPRRCVPRFDQVVLATFKGPTLLVNEDSMGEKVSLCWEVKVAFLTRNHILADDGCVIVEDHHRLHERDVGVIHSNNFWHHRSKSASKVRAALFLTIF